MPLKPTDPEALIFGWRKPRQEGRSLAFWMLIVLFGLAAFFYLFRVVYPQSQRFTPAPQQVLILNPADPASRAVMSKMRDLDFMVLPSDPEMARPTSLNSKAPVFHPSFEKHTMQLEDLPHKTFTVPPARLLRTSETVLPPLDLRELKTPPPSAAGTGAKPPQLVMHIAGRAAERALVSAPDLSNLNMPDPESYCFEIGVDAHGFIQFALPLECSDTQVLTSQLTARLKRTRFRPMERPSSNALDWGKATFAWSTAP